MQWKKYSEDVYQAIACTYSLWYTAASTARSHRVCLTTVYRSILKYSKLRINSGVTDWKNKEDVLLYQRAYAFKTKAQRREKKIESYSTQFFQGNIQARHLVENRIFTSGDMAHINEMKQLNKESVT